MSDEIYTLGGWRVQPGKEDEFVKAWMALGDFFHQLPDPPGEGTLLQSVDDPTEFYSFGPWRNLDDVQQMRSHPRTGTEIGKLLALCESGRPGSFRVVARA